MSDSVYRPPSAPLYRSPGDRRLPSEPRKLDFGRAFEVGFKIFQANVGLGAGLTAAFYGLMFLFVFTVVGIVLLPWMTAAMFLIPLYFARGTGAAGDVFAGFRRPWQVLGVSLLIGFAFFTIYLVITLPMLLSGGAIALAEESGNDAIGIVGVLGIVVTYALIFAAIPVILYLQARVFLAFPLVVEYNLGVREALAESWRLTSASGWWIAALLFVSNLIGQFGAYLCIVGLLFSMPMAFGMQGQAMQQLLGEDDGNLPQGALPPAERAGGAAANFPDPGQAREERRENLESRFPDSLRERQQDSDSGSDPYA